MRKSTLYSVPAPAKINRFLHIFGKKNNGFHLIETVFQLLDLKDILHLELLKSGNIECVSNQPKDFCSKNLVVQAANILKKASGVKYGAFIDLQKFIPIGSGLGGGSSDAASTLIALNRLWNCNFSRKDLIKLGANIGADVPFFIFGRNALAKNFGEQLTPLSLKNRYFLMIKPNVSVLTSNVFKNFNLTENIFSAKINEKEVDELQILLNRDKVFGKNDLKEIVCSIYPEVLMTIENTKRAIEPLKNYFPLNIDNYIQMSGSGSCIYIRCKKIQQALHAKREIINKSWIDSETKNIQRLQLLEICSSLSKHPLYNWVKS